MAHWAQIDNNNIVTRVAVGDDSKRDKGHGWLVDNFGGTWVMTSYDGEIRKNYAGIGFTYDEERDAFIPPKPFESWVLDEDTCLWEAPVALPDDADTVAYVWEEDSTSWIVAPLPDGAEQ